MKRMIDFCKILVIVMGSFLVLLALQNNATAQFDEQFSSSTLDPAWQVVEFTGTRVYGYTSPANHISLNDNSGYLRYYLDPMTHYDGFAYNFQTSHPPLHSSYDHDPGLEMRRTISGENWLLEAKASYYLAYTNGRYFTLNAYFGDGGIGTFSVQFQRYRDLGENRLRVMLVEKADSDPHIWPALEYADAICLDENYSTYYFKLERKGGILTAMWSEDGTTWNTAFTHDMVMLLDGLTQTVVVSGLSWFNTGDSYADWDYITVTPATKTVSIDIKPGSAPNSVNLKSRGKIPVAILSSEEFFAPEMLNEDSLTFGATGDEESLAFCNYRGEDINEDGLWDLVCHFYTEETGFLCGDTEGVLKGMTMDGTPVEGRDSVKIVPCKK